VLAGPTDVAPPRTLHPAFYGAYDWHSSVHSHWALVRLLRCCAELENPADIVAALDAHLHAEAIATEVAYCEAPHRRGFERPYGLAWLLQLAAEIREWRDAETYEAHRVSWLDALEPLERLAAERLMEWLEAQPFPIRSGEHGQTAFSMGLFLDWASSRAPELRERAAARCLELYSADRAAPLGFEPGGHDFLSPALAEADLMRRVLKQKPFLEWLEAFIPDMPRVPSGAWLRIVAPPDPSDGKLAHLAGLALSRAWMLEGIAEALPDEDDRKPVLLDAAEAHAARALPYVDHPSYELSHWMPGFAVYFLTRRGCS
jgi:hypothetical protein